MKLYEVTAELEQIIDDYELESEAQANELPDAVKARIVELKDDYHGKLSNIWALIKNYSAEADALKAEKQRLAARQSTAERRADWLKQYVAFCLGEGAKWQSPDGSRQFGWRKSEAVIVSDADAVPDAYCEFKRVPVLTEIKKDLKSGAEVPGATLESRLNLQVK
jgi:hypothetical protein